jgi:uncharacterized protein YdeI (YjbR/CyaY-like superfamily)
VSAARTVRPRFFETPADFRAWLRRNHTKADELLVGFRKRASGAGGITWKESVDEALCFGWVDGVRRTLDAGAYTIRFTPRRAGSTWSAVNLARAAALEAEGRMQPAGRAALARRTAKRSRTYSYERARPAELDGALLRLLQAERALWAFHETQAPSYRRKVVHWIASAKSDATKARRLRQLMAAYAQGKRL